MMGRPPDTSAPIQGTAKKCPQASQPTPTLPAKAGLRLEKDGCSRTRPLKAKPCQVPDVTTTDNKSDQRKSPSAQAPGNSGCSIPVGIAVARQRIQPYTPPLDGNNDRVSYLAATAGSQTCLTSAVQQLAPQQLTAAPHHQQAICQPLPTSWAAPIQHHWHQPTATFQDSCAAVPPIGSPQYFLLPSGLVAETRSAVVWGGGQLQGLQVMAPQPLLLGHLQPSQQDNRQATAGNGPTARQVVATTRPPQEHHPMMVDLTKAGDQRTAEHHQVVMVGGTAGHHHHHQEHQQLFVSSQLVEQHQQGSTSFVFSSPTSAGSAATNQNAAGQPAAPPSLVPVHHHDAASAGFHQATAAAATFVHHPAHLVISHTQTNSFLRSDLNTTAVFPVNSNLVIKEDNSDLHDSKVASKYTNQRSIVEMDECSKRTTVTTVHSNPNVETRSNKVADASNQTDSPPAPTVHIPSPPPPPPSQTSMIVLPTPSVVPVAPSKPAKPQIPLVLAHSATPKLNSSSVKDDSNIKKKELKKEIIKGDEISKSSKAIEESKLKCHRINEINKQNPLQNQPKSIEPVPDLSGLELLSNSIIQLEKHSADCDRMKSSDIEEESSNNSCNNSVIATNQTTAASPHLDDPMMGGLGLLCQAADIFEECTRRKPITPSPPSSHSESSPSPPITSSPFSASVDVKVKNDSSRPVPSSSSSFMHSNKASSQSVIGARSSINTHYSSASINSLGKVKKLGPLMKQVIPPISPPPCLSPPSSVQPNQMAPIKKRPGRPPKKLSNGQSGSKKSPVRPPVHISSSASGPPILEVWSLSSSSHNSSSPSPPILSPYKRRQTLSEDDSIESKSGDSLVKKRKVGRPRKRDNTPDSTETLVSNLKTSKALNMLFSNQQVTTDSHSMVPVGGSSNVSPVSEREQQPHKIKPKLKAEAKIKYYCDDDDELFDQKLSVVEESPKKLIIKKSLVMPSSMNNIEASMISIPPVIPPVTVKLPSRENRKPELKVTPTNNVDSSDSTSSVTTTLSISSSSNPASSSSSSPSKTGVVPPLIISTNVKSTDNDKPVAAVVSLTTAEETEKPVKLDAAQASAPPVHSSPVRIESPVRQSRKESHSPQVKRSTTSGENALPAALSSIVKSESARSLSPSTTAAPWLPQCRLTEEELSKRSLPLRVLYSENGLFYPGVLSEITPPDLYSVTLDNERARHPHILAREQIITDTMIEVKIDGMKLPTGTRLCALWSQQYNCLYPGVVTETALPTDEHILVEFDDGDKGSMARNQVRLLPPDFPLAKCDKNPLHGIGPRKRQSSTSVDSHSRHDSEPPAAPLTPQNVPEPKTKEEEKENENRNEEKKKKSDSKTIPVEERRKLKKKKKMELKKLLDDNIWQKLQTYKRKHKELMRHRHKHKHKHKKHKHKRDKSADTTSVDSSDINDSIRVPPVVVPVLSPSPPPAIIETSVSVAAVSSPKEPPAAAVESSPQLSKSEPATQRSNSTSKQKDKEKERRRSSSEVKSPMTHFIETQEFWEWSGKATKRKRKTHYNSMKRKNEIINVGDCAVFLSTSHPDRPYIGRIEALWETPWGSKVRVRWFYHPEETTQPPPSLLYPGGLFESDHIDENDVQTISHKCKVLEFPDYRETMKDELATLQQKQSAQSLLLETRDTYYIAGFYDAKRKELELVPGVVPTGKQRRT